MHTRFIAMMLILCLVIGLAACGEGDKVPGTALEQTVPETAAAAPSVAPAQPQPKSASSVQELVELSLDYFHSGQDYAIIQDYQDPQGYIALLLMEDFLRDQDLTLAQAMELAALFYGSAQELEQTNPSLAALLMEQMNVTSPDEFIQMFMAGLRDNFQSGAITSEHPNYDKLSQMLIDWDKGTDYIISHYPELLDSARDGGMAFSLEDAIEKMRRYGRMELSNTADTTEIFRDLQCEYRPENTFVGSTGLCGYPMGTVEFESDVWSVDMIYYVKDAEYYLIGYSYLVGSLGG